MNENENDPHTTKCLLCDGTGWLVYEVTDTVGVTTDKGRPVERKCPRCKGKGRLRWYE